MTKTTPGSYSRRKFRASALTIDYLAQNAHNSLCWVRTLSGNRVSTTPSSTLIAACFPSMHGRPSRLRHRFGSRALQHRLPYIVTVPTVFESQEC